MAIFTKYNVTTSSLFQVFKFSKFQGRRMVLYIGEVKDGVGVVGVSPPTA